MRRGFSLIEVLIALAILTASLIAIALATLGLPTVLMHARLYGDGARLAESGLSREMARGPEGFALSTSSAGAEGVFAHSLSLTPLGDGSMKRIDSSVSWQLYLAGERNVRLEGFITDYKNAADYACSPLLLGDWETPYAEELSAEVQLPLLSALTANRNLIIASASSTSYTTDPSLFVFERASGRVVEAYDLASTTKVGYGALAASGTHLFALSSASCPPGILCAALDLFSLEKQGLSLLGSIPLPPARSIAYRDGMLFIGLRTSPDGPEFLIYDMSDPLAPSRIGSSEIGDTVTTIVSDGTVAYLGTADNSVSGNKALMKYDVSAPAEDMLPTARSRQAGAGISQQLALSGNLLFLGRSSLLNSKELYVFAATDIEHAVSSADTGSSIAGIVPRGQEAFVLTRTRLERFITSDPAHFASLLDPFLLPTGMSAVALTCSASSLYVAANDSDGGHVIALTGL